MGQCIDINQRDKDKTIVIELIFILHLVTKHCIPVIKDVMNSLRMVTCWYDLGIELKVEKHFLDHIEADHSDIKRRLTEVIDAWLKSVSEPTYQKLIEALCVVGEMETAATELCEGRGECFAFI